MVFGKGKQKDYVPPTVFKKGHESWNKGKKCDYLKGNTNGFKKGSIPWNKGLSGYKSGKESNFYKDGRFKKSVDYSRKQARKKVKSLGWIYDSKIFVVHHVDGDPFNNKNSNLVLISRGLHTTIHYKQGDMRMSGLKRGEDY